MNILVTGSEGFIGRNLVENLKNIRDGKDQTHSISIEKIFCYDRADSEEDLTRYCKDADFVFHLAGVNRPENMADFQTGNHDFSATLLNCLKAEKNCCPIMLSSSIQAELTGRFENSEYGRSKRDAERIFLDYEKETGAKVLIYRFPNVFGKWCRPNYNSAVATFCHNIARDLPIRIDNPETELSLLYIDDLVATLLDALEGKERCSGEDGRYCIASPVYRTTVGEIAGLLQNFQKLSETGVMPEMVPDSFAKKLYATYVSYLPKKKIAYTLPRKSDARGSFTELIKTVSGGQVSVNIIKPNEAKGEHWHNSKWELFIVVSGHGLIQERRLGTEEVLSFEVSGDDLQAVRMLPGYAHSIKNLSETEELVTIMWANEVFDAARPDTFRERV